ncbi:OadG family transporter subunit [Shewanella sp. Isolate11]|uniref:OadG family protein n=1 Tax=Shewanella sp. Isolate11 TaxID=2908530 RepID=UPI001EFEEEAE|nr:OadG family transporter subunit [Shewanella sp. Isolate11]MCG9697258.1 OadG family protein [Shewanella sp. Isolate11]
MDSIVQQMLDALGIMVLGMGLVFLFLTTLIGAVNLVAWKFAPVKSDASDHADVPRAGQPQPISPKTVAAITAAIHQYRVKA